MSRRHVNRPVVTSRKHSSRAEKSWHAVSSRELAIKCWLRSFRQRHGYRNLKRVGWGQEVRKCSVVRDKWTGSSSVLLRTSSQSFRHSILRTAMTPKAACYVMLVQRWRRQAPRRLSYIHACARNRCWWMCLLCQDFSQWKTWDHILIRNTWIAMWGHDFELLYTL